MTTMQKQLQKEVEIDFLFIDLSTCDRCKGTDVNLETALGTVRTALEAADVRVTVRKTLVETQSQAMELGLVSSPTLRVNGRDIALELQESDCGSCAEACGCDGEVNCRVWVYQGIEHTVAPVPLIVHAILAAADGADEGTVTHSASKPVPENLKRFFAAKEAKAKSACCSTEKQTTCCEPDQKASCCAPSRESSQPAGCGCQ